ncbi:MAG: very short patch repair endonuclease [Rhodospirillaceae bacterium]|nr:very short patch repair endonuclease [Rhodospirillaceae bacterium]
MGVIVIVNARSEIMGRIRSKGTKPEMTVRRLLHSMGYRYRLHVAGLPGKPDIVFPARRKVVEVRGCFWHQHKDPGCAIARRPKTNRNYWLPKLERNVERDANHESELRALGWDVLVVWECEVLAGPGFVERVIGFLDQV